MQGNAEFHWRWTIKGLSGVLAMMIALDAEGPAMTAEQWDALNQDAQTLGGLLQRQESKRTRQPLTEGT